MPPSAHPPPEIRNTGRGMPRVTAMAAFLFDNLKLAILYAFIASVIVLSQPDGETPNRIKHTLKRWIGAALPGAGANR